MAFVRSISLDMFCLGAFTWESPSRSFHLGSDARDLLLGNFRIGDSFGKVRLGNVTRKAARWYFDLGTFVLKLLRTFAWDQRLEGSTV